MATNPVTFRATLKDHPSNVCLTLGRLHVQFEDQPVDKNLPVTLYRESKDTRDVESILGIVILDEDHFLNGLRELFPDYVIVKKETL